MSSVAGPGLLAYATATERRELLAQTAREEGYCTVLELAQRFAVSEMTIRRDVARLVQDGRLRAFHGGVGSLSPSDLHGSDYRARDQTMSAPKRAIAERAVHYIAEGVCVGIDAGTTAAHLASLIPASLHAKVVTQSLPVLTAAADAGIDFESLGGDFHAESRSFSGPSTLAAISNLRIDTLFLAASGLNERGAFCANGFDAITKRALIEVADRVVLLADSSKFTTSATVRISGWEAIGILVIDDGVSAADRAVVSGFDVDIDVVSYARGSEVVGNGALTI